MGFHKHGVFSFHVKVERMVIIGGDNFVAQVTALRRHGPSGAAERLEVPAIREEYGATAPQAEARVIQVVRDWLNAATETTNPPRDGAASRQASRSVNSL